MESRLVPTVTLSLAPQASVVEGDTGTTSIQFVVNRDGDLSYGAMVQYATADGTAVAGKDYVATSGTLYFNPNQISATISVPVINDTVLRADRSFTVQLSDPALTTAFADPVSFGTGIFPGMPAVADFNGDGKLDLAVANNGDGTVSVLLNDTSDGAATPSFMPQRPFTVGNEPVGVVVADFNGDGKPDLAVLNQASGTVSVLLNNTAVGAQTPSFAAAQTFSVPARPASIAAGDFNNDGKPDLAVVGYSYDSGLLLLLNSTVPDQNTLQFTPQAVNYTGQNGPVFVAAADLNGDGKTDLAIANYAWSGSGLSVLLNTTPAGEASASFNSQSYATSGAASFVGVGDLNGDGRPDLAVVDVGQLYTDPGALSLFVNQTPSGADFPAFTLQQTLTTGAHPRSVALGDFNNDGKLDLAVNDPTSPAPANTASVFVNTTATPGSTLTFSPRLTVPAGGAPFYTAAADVNGDGRSDLLVANTSAVSVLPATAGTDVQLAGSQATGTIHDNDPPVAPTLNGPGTTPVTKPTFSWNAIEGVASYEFWVDNTSTGQTQVIHVTDLTDATFMPTTPLKAGTYVAWVRGFNGIGVAGPWSSGVSFAIAVPAAPALTGPGTTLETQPTLSWNAVAGAGTYELWVNNSSTGQSQVIHVTNLTSTSYTPGTDLPTGTYTSWVRAVNAAGDTGAWSAAAVFTIIAPSAPILTAPGTQTTDTQPTFTWQAATGAVSYELWLDNVSTAQAAVIHLTGLTGTSYATPVALALGTYRVWLRSYNVSGDAGPWGPGATFSIRSLLTPALNGPGPEADTPRPTFSWTSVASATTYELWVDNNTTTGQNKVLYRIGLTDMTFTPDAADGLPLGSYTAWVRAGRQGSAAPDAVSAWSDGWNFAVVNLTTPHLTGPAAVGAQAQPAITWDAVAHASRYELWVTDQATGNRTIYRNDLTNSSFTPATNLPVGSYIAWVRAYRADGVASAWSQPYSFTIVAPLPPSLSITGTAATTAIAWSAVDGASSYEIWIDNLTTGQSQVVDTQWASTSYPVGTLPRGTYRVWVRSANALGQFGAWSDGLQFSSNS
jgi:hypothetical protein